MRIKYRICEKYNAIAHDSSTELWGEDDMKYKLLFQAKNVRNTMSRSPCKHMISIKLNSTSFLLLSVTLPVVIIHIFTSSRNISEGCVRVCQVEIMRLISQTSFWVIRRSDYYVLLAETHCPIALMHFHRLIAHQSKALKLLQHVEAWRSPFPTAGHHPILTAFHVCPEYR